VLARAAAEPEMLVVGVDAEATRMAEASRRAGRSAAKGGRPNARFLMAAAETLPDGLAGLADVVTINFPWGSLLRGLVRGERWLLDALAGISRPGAEIRALVSVIERDRGAGLPPLDEDALGDLAAACPAAGLTLREGRPARSEEVAATGSTWARRLGDRPVWALEIRRVPQAVAAGASSAPSRRRASSASTAGGRNCAPA
jgi:16S rRNA (adenine(1408)-N(1))-methyltransferase